MRKEVDLMNARLLLALVPLATTAAALLAVACPRIIW
jgi:hypothetical protein